jgi:hypothetical protein
MAAHSTLPALWTIPAFIEALDIRIKKYVGILIYVGVC